MKKIAISLVIVFLTCQVSYAMCPYERLIQRVESGQELTQEEIDEILYELIESIDSVGPNQMMCLAALIMMIGVCTIEPGGVDCTAFTNLAIFLCLLGI